MDKLNIYIMRHGEKIGGEEGPTERGKRQVNALAKRLLKLRITKIYSSDLLRCKESAEIISKKLRLPVK
jgi:broad specificity phosphatase PhoE